MFIPWIKYSTSSHIVAKATVHVLAHWGSRQMSDAVSSFRSFGGHAFPYKFQAVFSKGLVEM